MKHPYSIECPCERCRKEYQRRMRQATQSQDRVRESKRQKSLDRQARWHYDHGDHDPSMNG